MLYIMCLFQVLPHSDIDMANANIPSGTAVNVHVVSPRVLPQPTMSQFLYCVNGEEIKCFDCHSKALWMPTSCNIQKVILR